MSQRDIRREEVERENELLSDLLYHDGWKIVEKMLQDWEDGEMNKLLAPADSEWDAIKKEGVLKAIASTRTLFSQFRDRAGRYRKGNKLK